MRKRLVNPATIPLVWLTLFFAGPLIGVVGVSFLTRGSYGELELPITFENYKRVAGFGLLGFDPLYPIILARSLMIAATTALLCVLCALPAAFYIAGLSRRAKLSALTLLVIPFWTNLLVRTYAWQILLGPNLYPSGFAVMIALVCDYLPFAALPIYASVERINWELAEAARDLGAGAWQTFRHGILPQIRAGLLAGAALVFLPATGQFVIPDLLGGAKTVLLGNLLQQQFGPSRDWAFGAAIATVSTAIVLIGLLVQARLNRRTA